MSIAQFQHLSSEERDLVYQAPAIVAYLIGGADDNFDAAEQAQSKHVVHIRTSTGDPILFDFYKETGERFDADLKNLATAYGSLQAEERTRILVEELAKLNEILPKVDSLYARAYLKSLRTLGRAVAEASGGIFGFIEVSYEEKHLLGLEMITVEP